MIDLDNNIMKIHGCAMKCHELLIHGGYSEANATDTIIDYLNELKENGVFELGHHAVMTYLKSAFVPIHE